VLTGDSVNVTVVAANNGANSESFGVTAYASSSNSTRIYFDPTYSEFNVNNVSVGYRFNETLMVKNVQDLTAWQVRMFYDDSIVNVTRWFEPTWDPSCVFYGQTTLPLPQPPEYEYNHYGPANGSALVASELFPWPPANQQHSFTGSGKLCIFEFEVLAVPPGNQSYSCDLNVNNPDTGWIDSQENWYTFDVYQNGYYWLGTGPTPPPPAQAQYLIGTTNVVNLGPGSTVSLTFVWNTTEVQPHSYVIWAEADVLPGEINTDNNVLYDGTVEVAKAPTASFSYSRVGELFTFDASSSTPGSGHILSYAWDFGDGNTTTTGDPIITHMYSPNPSSNVTLTIENSDGFNGTTRQLIVAFQHDVAVINVAPYSSWVYQSHSIMINATIANFGDYSENVTVDLYYNVTAGLKIDTETAVLAPNESQTLTFTWNTTSVPSNQKYNMTAAATIAVDDVPANNILTGESVNVRLLGDVNGDGKIDIRDISTVAKAFGAVGPDYKYHGSQASPNWNSDADLNLDNRIDIRDVSIVAKGFGTGHPA